MLLRIRRALNAVAGDRVAEALERLGQDRAAVVVDLSAVDRVDLAGLAGLGTRLRTSRRLRQDHTALILSAPSPAVSNLLREHGLTSTVTVTHPEPENRSTDASGGPGLSVTDSVSFDLFVGYLRQRQAELSGCVGRGGPGWSRRLTPDEQTSGPAAATALPRRTQAFYGPGMVRRMTCPKCQQTATVTLTPVEPNAAGTDSGHWAVVRYQCPYLDRMPAGEVLALLGLT